MFGDVRKLVSLMYEGYTDSEGSVYSGERDEGFTIVDKFSQSHGRPFSKVYTDTSEEANFLPDGWTWGDGAAIGNIGSN